MSMRPIFCCGVLVGGAVLGGAISCAPSVEANTITQEETVTGDFCGGIAGIPCPEGLICVDDPRDDCNPAQGGADCGGICRKEPPGQARCTAEEHGLHYVSRDPEECRAILFSCPGHQSPFFNACGCGCRPGRGGCDYDDPNRIYIVRSREECSRIRFFCESGFTPFFDDCGCGCERTP